MAEENGLARIVSDRVEGQNALSQMLMRTDSQGNTAMVIPAELSKKFNVIAPAAVLAQANNFTPTFSVVQLDLDADFYPFDKEKVNGQWVPKTYALSKQGLRTISDAAGIEFDGDKSGGRETGEELVIDLYGTAARARNYTYHAVGYLRRSDGTRKQLTADVEWQPQLVALELRMEVEGTRWINEKPEAQWPELRRKELVKRFIQSQKYRAGMCKSKAQNAIIRDKTRQKYTPQEAAKPFFIVGYNLTLDASDASSAAILAALVGADKAVLGFGGEQSPALPAASNFEYANEDELPPGDFDAAPSDEYVDAEVIDPEAEEWAAQLAILDGYKLPFTNKRGKTCAQVWESDGAEWFAKAEAHWQTDAANPDHADMYQSLREYAALRKQAEGGE